MTPDRSTAVVSDTMAMSAIVNEARRPDVAARYRSVIAGRAILISVVTVSELRYGSIVAGWGEFRRRGLERELARATAVEADDTLASTSAELKAACRSVGHALSQKIHDADRWIAATAIARGLDLTSDDAVFEQAPGLSLVTTNPSRPQAVPFAVRAHLYVSAGGAPEDLARIGLCSAPSFPTDRRKCASHGERRRNPQ